MQCWNVEIDLCWWMNHIFFDYTVRIFAIDWVNHNHRVELAAVLEGYHASHGKVVTSAVGAKYIIFIVQSPFKTITLQIFQSSSQCGIRILLNQDLGLEWVY